MNHSQGMAKIAIKSDKLTPFGGIFPEESDFYLTCHHFTSSFKDKSAWTKILIYGSVMAPILKPHVLNIYTQASTLRPSILVSDNPILLLCQHAYYLNLLCRVRGIHEPLKQFDHRVTPLFKVCRKVAELIFCAVEELMLLYICPKFITKV